MRYPFVLFDVGETLIGPRRSYGAAYARVLGDLGLVADPARLERELRSAIRERTYGLPPGVDRYADARGGEIGFWHQIVRMTLERSLDRPVDRTLVGEVLVRLRANFSGADAWDVYDDVRPMLAGLRRLGCRTAIVSNWDSRLPALLERLDLSRWFDTIAVSHLEGIEKPAPELFLRALRRISGRPQHALHVGNVPAYDLEGARAAGIDAVLVDRGSGEATAHDPLPDLSSLPAIASGLSRA